MKLINRILDIRVFNKHQIEGALTRRLCFESTCDAMIAVSEGKAHIPLRHFEKLPVGSGSVGVMTGFAPDLGVFGTKLISLLPNNPKDGRPAIQGTVTLFDHESGAPVGVFDADCITAYRTSAASAVASRFLAKPHSTSHGILGTGVQALHHALALANEFPSINLIRLWGRSAHKTDYLASQLRKLHKLRCEVATLDEVTKCDIVSTVTGSKTPLFDLDSLNPGTHINLVGSHTPCSREVGSSAIQASRLFVDSRQAALAEAGDIIIPVQESIINESHILAELGEIIVGTKAGRISNEDITIFKSLGNAALDIYAAYEVYKAINDV